MHRRLKKIPKIVSKLIKVEVCRTRVPREYKLLRDLRPRGQSLNLHFLLQHCIDHTLESFITKILLDA